MLTDYYLDAVHGSDSNASPVWNAPWKTISKLLTDSTNGLLSGPITADTTIHLAGSLTAPSTYDYLALDLTGVICMPGVTLAWQPYFWTSIGSSPTEWSDPDYCQGNDPYGGSSAVDPLNGVRPCMFSGGITVANGANNVFRNIGIMPAAGPGALSYGLLADGCAVSMIYCVVGPLAPTPVSVGFCAVGGAVLTVENSLVSDVNAGAIVVGAALTLAGNNWFVDCGAVGVQAWADARVVIQPWYGPGLPSWRTTTIQTASPRAAYKAIWASASKIIILDMTPLGVTNRAQLQIIKQDLHGNDEYYGVVLEAQSLLLGAKLVMFTNPALATTQPAFETVPAGNQIVLKPGQGCVRID